MTQQRIRILDETTINQIAAGEVIENPASVIKELIENSLDAEAHEILVETVAGGRGMIRVTDDGKGMYPDDLLLSVERHATSKLRDVEGLEYLSTLGFRGEALPSIASISKMALHSAPISGEGMLLSIEGGKLGKLQPMPRGQGTTVEVKSLFFNVPVRKKFQKSLHAEVAEIHRMLIKFTLSHPKLGLSWHNERKLIFSVTASEGRERRMELLLGEEFVAQAFSLEEKSGSLALSGKISYPTLHRPNKRGQFLFLNGRSLFSSFVSQKVMESYATRLPSHRFPLFILHLELPPSWIDVNVHPQKREVRLREEEKLGRFIHQALEKALEQSNQPAQYSLSPLTIPPQLSSLFDRKEASFTLDHWQETASPALGANVSSSLLAEEETVYTISQKEQQPLLFPTQVRILGRVNNHFFVQEEEGIRLVDGNRALERIVFEELTEESRQPAVQTLLLPLSIQLPQERATEEKLKELNDRGISIRHFGSTTYLVDALPSSLEIHEAAEVIQSWLEGTVSTRLGALLQKRNFTLSMAAALIEKLYKCKNPDFTPEGKKIHRLLDAQSIVKLL